MLRNQWPESVGICSRLLVQHGKGGKDRIVHISPDIHQALGEYLKFRPRAKAQQTFLVEKGFYTDKPLFVQVGAHSRRPSAAQVKASGEL